MKLRFGLSLCTAVAALAACGTEGELLLGRLTSQESEPVGAGGSTADEPVNPEGGSGPLGWGGLGGFNPGLMPCASSSLLPSPDHRFDFSGTGSEVHDLVGARSGVVLGGARLDGSGQLRLDGVDDYVDLPNHLLGDADAVSFVLWVAGPDGPAYWRIFDFGTSRDGEDPTVFTAGSYYIALTPESGFTPSGLVALAADGGPSSQYVAPSFFELGSQRVALAVVVDSASDLLQLYVDGQVVSQAEYPADLSEIEDVNNWLGRSQYSADPYFPGIYDEFRIYHRALSGCEVSAITARGANRVD